MTQERTPDRLCQRCGGDGSAHGLMGASGCTCERCAQRQESDRCRAFWFPGHTDPLLSLT